MTTTLMPEQARRPDFDVDPLRDVETALSGLEWVTATHEIAGDDGAAFDRVVALGRYLIVTISLLLVFAIIAAG